MPKGPLYGPFLQAYIVAGAIARGVDPVAALSIAQVEGGFGPPPHNIGDSGTSFGPFQLHIGGALPSNIPASYAPAWANSEAGLNYALDQIAAVAKNLTGHAAITAIASRFEHPKDVPGEIANAWGYYPIFAQEPLVKAGGGAAGARAAGSPPTPTAGTSTTQPARPGDGAPAQSGTGTSSGNTVTGGQTVSWEGDILKGWEGYFNPGSLIFGSGLGGLKKAYDAGLDSLKLIFHFLTAALWLLDPRNWLRVFEGLLGVGMILWGLHELGSPDDGPDLSLKDVQHPIQAGRQVARQGESGAASLGRSASRSSFAGRSARRAAKVVK